MKREVTEQQFMDGVTDAINQLIVELYEVIGHDGAQRVVDAFEKGVR